VFFFTDTMPSFPGGEDSLKHYLSAHVRYPAPARENGHQGTVVVQFNVEPDGSLDHVVAMDNRLDTTLGVEAVRLVTGMPRWNPGYKDGKAVAVRYSLPIRFVLQ
jgi:protein TonB